MALESATYISDLVDTNPTSSDTRSEGDDHLRLIKAVLQATFPNINGAINGTPTNFNNILVDFTFQSTDAGASEAPDVIIDRYSASPAASDTIGGLIFRGRNSLAAAKTYAKIFTSIVDPTSASEDGELIAQIMAAGALGTVLDLQAAQAIISTVSAGTIKLRPNGVASSTGEFSVDSSGNVITDGIGTFNGGEVVIKAPASSPAIYALKRNDGTVAGELYYDYTDNSIHIATFAADGTTVVSDIKLAGGANTAGMSFGGTSLYTDLGKEIDAATAKTTLADSDEFGISDSAASHVVKKITWANIYAALFTLWGSLINGGTSKSTPVDADSFAISDSASSNATKKLTWANVKATLKTYFDTLYVALTDLASTASSKGASLVSIHDSGSLITATTVEDALQEIVTNSKALSYGGEIISTWNFSSNVGHVDFTNLGAYQTLRLVIAALGADDAIELQFSTDNGATWKTSGYSAFAADDDTGNNWTTGIGLSQSNQGFNPAGINNSAIAEIELFNVDGAYTVVFGLLAGWNKFGGRSPAAVAYNALRVLSSTGNITAGQITLIGWRSH